MKKSQSLKVIAIFLCILLIFQQTGFAQVASVELNIVGHLASLRNAFTPDKFRPLHLRYISYDGLNNNFKLLLDKGDTKNPKTQDIESTTKNLLNYFFVGIALPNDTFWVNLRPDSPNDIIDPLLAQTEVGKILLEADLQLKKDTAKATSPETPEGRDYWNKLYKKAGELYGSQNITIPTLTRPWIVPDEIIIRESTDSAYVHKATLKVMLEQDYLKGNATYSFKDPREKELNEYSSQIIREKIIPKLTKEINSAKRYAPLRQVYYSLILSQWFKARNANKNTQYSRLINRKDLSNLQSKTPYSVNTYFNAYKENFEKGEYNIKEPTYTPYGQVIRSYFSGGMVLIPNNTPLAEELARSVGALGNKSVLSVASAVNNPNSNLAEVNVQGSSINVAVGVATTGQANPVVGAMHEGQQDAAKRLNALRRLLRMKGIDIEVWAQEQKEKMNNRDRRALREALFNLGLSDEQVDLISDKIVLVDVPEGIRLEGKTSRVGGVIIRTNNGYKILLPRDRIMQALQNKEYLADLLHEVVEMQLLEQGVDVDRAHAQAMEARDRFLGKDNVSAAEFDSIMKSEIERERSFDTSPSNAVTTALQVLSIVEDEGVSLIDDAPGGGSVYSVFAFSGDEFLVFTDQAENIVGLAVNTKSGNTFQFYDMERGPGDKYKVLPKSTYYSFSVKFNAVLQRAREGKVTIKDERLRYGSARVTEKLEGKLFMPLMNIYYGLPELRNDFINNPIIRNLIRALGPRLFFSFSGVVRFLYGGDNNASGISFGDQTWYDLHTLRTMDFAYFHHLSTLAHEITHELFARLEPNTKKELVGYFLSQRTDLAKVILAGPLYKDNKGESLVNEMIAFIVGCLADGQKIVSMQDSALSYYFAPIRGSDIEVLVKYGFLPSEFIPLAEERARFSSDKDNIDLEYLARVYPQTKSKFTDEELDKLKKADRKQNKIVGAMHEANTGGRQPEAGAMGDEQEQIGIAGMRFYRRPFPDGRKGLNLSRTKESGYPELMVYGWPVEGNEGVIAITGCLIGDGIPRREGDHLLTQLLDRFFALFPNATQTNPHRFIPVLNAMLYSRYGFRPMSEERPNAWLGKDIDVNGRRRIIIRDAQLQLSIQDLIPASDWDNYTWEVLQSKDDPAPGNYTPLYPGAVMYKGAGASDSKVAPQAEAITPEEALQEKREAILSSINQQGIQSQKLLREKGTTTQVFGTSQAEDHGDYVFVKVASGKIVDEFHFFQAPDGLSIFHILLERDKSPVKGVDAIAVDKQRLSRETIEERLKSGIVIIINPSMVDTKFGFKLGGYSKMRERMQEMIPGGIDSGAIAYVLAPRGLVDLARRTFDNRVKVVAVDEGDFILRGFIGNPSVRAPNFAQAINEVLQKETTSMLVHAVALPTLEDISDSPVSSAMDSALDEAGDMIGSGNWDGALSILIDLIRDLENIQKRRASVTGVTEKWNIKYGLVSSADISESGINRLLQDVRDLLAVIPGNSAEAIENRKQSTLREVSVTNAPYSDIVNQREAVVAKDGLLVTTGLGPCIGVALWNPDTKAGALIHFDRATDAENLPEIINKIGGNKGSLRVSFILGIGPSFRTLHRIKMELIRQLGLEEDAVILRYKAKVGNVAFDLRTGELKNYSGRVSYNVPPPSLSRFIIRDAEVSSSPVADQVKTTGGIDFRFLPIVTQSMDSLKASIRTMPQASLERINLTQELSDIERLVNSGITPSAERIKDYLAASCFKGNLDSDMDKIVSCISDILRMQEETCCATDPTLKDILVVLGSGRSGAELKVAFSGVI